MSERAMPRVPLYDAFEDYDRFVNWERRLAHELPFVEAQLASVGAHTVVDVACGTGRHAIALAQRGYQVVGADLSALMIERARQNAAARAAPAPGQVSFVVAGFGELVESGAVPEGGADALICLGNSLPHVLSETDLLATLRDWHAALRPGGLVLVQNRNFDAILARRERWMPLLQAQADGHEWLFLRFYDFDEEGLTFNVLTLERSAGEPWRQRVEATRLYPWRREQLVDVLARAGFSQVVAFGDMAGGAFDRASSGNLVLRVVK